MSTSQIIDLCYLSDTMPDLPSRFIPRDNYLDSIEQELKEKRVFFLQGKEGTGVTTTLALFASYHHYNCISYFNNGLVKHLLEPSFIEQSLIRQLCFFIDRSTVLPDEIAAKLSLKGLYIKLRRRIRQTGEPLYFVFDGFENVPPQSRDNIRMLMESLPWDMGRFVFSGTYDTIKEYLPKTITYAPDQTLQKFTKYDVTSFLKEIQEGLPPEDYEALYKISGSIGTQLQAMLHIYDKHQSFAPILQLSDGDANDLFAYNFKVVDEAKNRDDALKLLALIAFIGIRLTKDDVCHVLSMDIDQLTDALSTCEDYLVCRDSFVVFNSESNQRYVKKRLSKLQHEIELLFIQQFKNRNSNPEVYSYMPVLLKSHKDTEGLVAYLNSEVVMKNIEKQQSQAALNEQCELGFSSIKGDDLSQTANLFRFALNKSASREIELNELWDNQIEALMAVGSYDKAFGLALSVYLKEERLKALLLIARKKEQIPSSVMDEVRSNINLLAGEIDFAHIPDKAMELAKLMFPYDYRKAVDIIERVAKVTKNRFPIDRLYTLLSMSSGQERDNENGDKFEVISSKIENDELKRMTRATRSIFNKTDVEDILDELRSLPSVYQGILLLQYWIPEHPSIEGIGKLVIYAVQSVIAVSHIERPKVKFISDFCTALPNMTPSEIDQVIVMLDSFQSSLLTPSEEYVRLELKVVEALFTFNSERACERMQNLYLKVDDFSNKSTVVSCKSIILGRYESLGNKKALEKAVMPAFELQREIEDEIKQLFTQTAYHLKIVENPIRSLVVSYPSSIETIISGINTLDRRSQAYMMAAEAYVNQVEPKDWNWGYLTGLIAKTDYEKDSRSQIVYALTKEVIHAKEPDATLLEKIKDHRQLFFNVEHALAKCSVLADLYVLGRKISPDDEFSDALIQELNVTWEKVDMLKVKVDLGFLIAKTIAKTSVEEASEWIRKVTTVQQNSVMTSSSSVLTYRESMDLYVRSMGLLVRSKLVDDNTFEVFSNTINEFESRGEAIISWSSIALYYYLIDDKKFDEIYTSHIAKSLDQFSDYYKKYILYNAAPAFYLGSHSFFYAQIEKLDPKFQDLCISRVAKFIFVKYPEINDAEGYHGGYELNGRDCDCLLDLLDHCEDDNTFFAICDSLCQSLPKSSRGISQDQKQLAINRIQGLIESKLPMKDGIQHDGYKLACQISLSPLLNATQTRYLWDEWDSKIENINNTADQVFLYVHAAHYTSRTEKRQYFMNKASALIKTIPSTFDQTARIDFCIDECRNTTIGLTKDMVKQFMEIIYTDKDGKIADVKRAYDSIYDYDPKLADTFLERMDRDPARLYYKTQLVRHSQRTKRIASTKERKSRVTDLTLTEQRQFFGRQLADQISNKSQIYSIEDTIDILSVINKYPISEVHDALSYFLENVYRKQQLSGNQANLIQGLHEATLFNLKLVLALSSGTKEKLDKISHSISGSGKQSASPQKVEGKLDEIVEKVTVWYTAHPYDNLFVIDPHFAPDNMVIIKSLMGVNSNLSATIITHRCNVQNLSEYQAAWNLLSAELTGSVSIHVVSYMGSENQGPLSDSCWLCIDEDEDRRLGIWLSTTAGILDFKAMEPVKVENMELLAMSYALGKKKRKDDYALRYETITIE